MPAATELDLANDPRIGEIIDTAPAEPVTFVELGAWDGYHTRLMAERLLAHDRAFSLYAVEPDRRRLESFEITTEPVRGWISLAAGVAIGAEDAKRAPFYVSDGSHLGSSSIHKPKLHLQKYPECFFTESSVRLLTLDSFCYARSINRIDLLWADIQGAELDMIAGGKQALARTRYLYTEYAKDYYEGAGGLEDILAQLPGWMVIEDFGGDALLRNNLGPAALGAVDAGGG